MVVWRFGGGAQVPSTRTEKLNPPNLQPKTPSKDCPNHYEQKTITTNQLPLNSLGFEPGFLLTTKWKRIAPRPPNQRTNSGEAEQKKLETQRPGQRCEPLEQQEGALEALLEPPLALKAKRNSPPNPKNSPPPTPPPKKIAKGLAFLLKKKQNAQYPRTTYSARTMYYVRSYPNRGRASAPE